MAVAARPVVVFVVLVIAAHEPRYFPFARNRAKAFNVASEA
jgi:hypothetical protein